MTFSDSMFYALLAALGGLSGTAGYLLGLRRFAARAHDELQTTQAALAEARAARETAERDLQAAKTAARETPLWQAWIHERFPVPRDRQGG